MCAASVSNATAPSRAASAVTVVSGGSGTASGFPRRGARGLEFDLGAGVRHRGGVDPRVGQRGRAALLAQPEGVPVDGRRVRPVRRCPTPSR